jgi:hypothetical protein
MPRVGFEPTIPVFERAKPVHALERAAAVIGKNCVYALIENILLPQMLSLITDHHNRHNNNNNNNVKV